MSELLQAIPTIIPKQKNRFFVKFPKPFKIHEMATHKVSPLIYNCERNGWEDITLELYDGYMFSVPYSYKPSDNKTETYVAPSQAIVKAFNIISKGKTNKKLNLIIEKLDPSLAVLERWEVKGYIKNVNFGSLNYDSDEVSNVKILFKVDKASLKLH